MSVWHMTVTMLSSGKISGRASIVTLPVFGLNAAEGAPSGPGVYHAILHFTLFALSLWHTAFVSIPSSWRVADSSPASLTGPESSANHSTSVTPSPWFRFLCQVVFFGLTACLIMGMSANSSALRLAVAYDLSDTDVPDPVNLPAAMYHDLWAPARFLLPAKISSVDATEEGQCTLMSDGSWADLLVSEVHDWTPLWAREDDSSSLDALMKMMVRYMLDLRHIRDAVVVARVSAPHRCSLVCMLCSGRWSCARAFAFWCQYSIL